MANETPERRQTAWIGQGVSIEGRVSSAQDLRIDGRVDGTVEVGEHEVVLGPSAEVKANLTARSILVGGTVIGDVVATERLRVEATGVVQGDVRTPRALVADGAIVRGKVDIAGGRG